eukprot:6176002-Pleurochrysis_carterae.AAC.4
MKRRCDGMTVRLRGELTARVCSSASSGSSVFSIAATTRCANGWRTMYSTMERWSITHCEPWKTSGKSALGHLNESAA